MKKPAPEVARGIKNCSQTVAMVYERHGFQSVFRQRDELEFRILSVLFILSIKIFWPVRLAQNLRNEPISGDDRI